MSRIEQQRAIKGSQKWLQVLVNQNPEFLNNKIRAHIPLKAEETIKWLSPLEEDSFAEYQDEDFLKRVSIRLENHSLDSFWPHGGPVWDGLGKTSNGNVILVEAKSHISELASTCQAKPQSRKLIRASLAETASFYGSTSPDNWLQDYYQYANRLAHLYLLRNLNKVPAWLVFVCFVNDHEMAGPKSVREWQSAIETIHAHLGIKPERLIPYIVDVFFDVETDV